MRATREGQPQEASHLVEGFTSGVIDGGTHRVDHSGHVIDPEQGGVATRDQHRKAWLGEGPVLELVDGHMRGQVIDAVQRLVE